MIIAPAKFEDLEPLLKMGETMVAEANRYFPPIERERSAQTLYMAIANPDSLHLTVAMTDTNYAGFLLAAISDYPYSTERRATIDTIYTMPDYRGSTAGPRLMREALDWIGDVRPVILGDSANIEPRVFAMFVGRHGFEHAGTIYRLERHECAPALK